MNIYLVDTENMASSWIPLLENSNETDKFYLFVTINSPKLAYEHLDVLVKNYEKIETIRCTTGNNALDFQLSCFLGILLGASGEENNYYIVSKDHGFNPVAKFALGQGYRVKRIDVTDKDKKKPCQAEEVNTEGYAELYPTAEIKANSQTPTSQADCRDEGLTQEELIEQAGEYFEAMANDDSGKVSYLPIKQIEIPVTPIKTNKKTTSKKKENSQKSSKSREILKEVLSVKADNPDILEAEKILSKYNANDLADIYRAFVKKYGQKKGCNTYGKIKKRIVEYYAAYKTGK